MLAAESSALRQENVPGGDAKQVQRVNLAHKNLLLSSIA